MVSVDPSRTDDRGQLILIGAIAIALIIVGVVLVVNTALFTEVVGSEGTVETAKESGVAAEELSDSTSAAVHEANVQTDDYVGPVETNASDWIDELEPRLVNNSLDGRGAFVRIEYVDDADTGAVAKQDPSQPLTGPLSGNWHPIPGGAQVGHFTLVLDTSTASTSDPFVVTVDEVGTAATETLEVSYDGSDVDLTVGGTTACSDVDPTADRVRLEVVDGRMHEAPNCSFDLIESTDTAYTMEFEHGDDWDGGYTLVTNNATLNDDVLYPSNVETGAAIWSYDLEYTYDTGDVRTEGEREVNVYD